MTHNLPQPRSEYPRPTWKRREWKCLNGSWAFSVASSECELSQVPFDRTIQVPFAPESSLSGIGDTGFMECVWYRRVLQFPKKWQGKKVLLHFQAVDYDATVWVDGVVAATHRGCFTPITVTIPAERPEQVEIVVRACTLRQMNRPRGKQSDKLENYLCCYTRTSGI